MAKKDKVTVIVLESFQDKYDHKTQYPVGAGLQVDQERADDLVSRKLAGIKEPEPAKKPKTKAPEAPKAAKEEKAVEVPEQKETEQKDDQRTEEQ